MHKNSILEVHPNGIGQASQPSANAIGDSPSYAVLALRPGHPIQEIALSRSVAAMQALSYMPMDELRGCYCAIVVTPSDLAWWQICCQALMGAGMVMQPFASRAQAMTWLAFIAAAAPD